MKIFVNTLKNLPTLAILNEVIRQDLLSLPKLNAQRTQGVMTAITWAFLKWSTTSHVLFDLHKLQYTES